MKRILSTLVRGSTQPQVWALAGDDRDATAQVEEGGPRDGCLPDEARRRALANAGAEQGRRPGACAPGLRPSIGTAVDHSFVIASSTSSLAALRAGSAAAATAAIAANTTITPSCCTGTVNVLKPLLSRACTRLQPNPRPIAVPNVVPSSAINTDSHRTVDRTCFRLMPT